MSTSLISRSWCLAVIGLAACTSTGGDVSSSDDALATPKDESATSTPDERPCTLTLQQGSSDCGPTSYCQLEAASNGRSWHSVELSWFGDATAIPTSDASPGLAGRCVPTSSLEEAVLSLVADQAPNLGKLTFDPSLQVATVSSGEVSAREPLPVAGALAEYRLRATTAGGATFVVAFDLSGRPVEIVQTSLFGEAPRNLRGLLWRLYPTALKIAHPKLTSERTSWGTELVGPVGRLRVQGRLAEGSACNITACSGNTLPSKDCRPCDDDANVRQTRQALADALGTDVTDVAVYLGHEHPNFELNVSVRPGQELDVLSALDGVNAVSSVLVP